MARELKVVHAVLAHESTARGFPPDQVIPATIVAVLLSAAVMYGAWRYRRRQFAGMERLVRYAEQRSGLAGWASIATAITAVSLVIAVFGFYWDVAWHIDKGRDEGPFATPAHFPIIIGLAGIALAGTIAVVLGTEERTRTSVRIRQGWNAPVGGVLMLICGVVALAGFPLDDLWHTIFGQDVTLWGPTHIQMIGGASLATLAMWVLLEEARRLVVQPAQGRRNRVLSWMVRHGDVLLGGAFMLGLSTLQGEFDYGVPQFRLLFHPVLIMLAAGIGLVAARVRVGRGGAIGAAVFFLVLRTLLMLAIGPGFGRSILHFPLYLPEALLVEAAALLVPKGRQVTLGAVSGVLVGTIGLAAEWGWSHVWMPFPWPASLLPEGAVLGFVAALAGGLLGGLAGRALLPVGAERQRSPRFSVALAWVAALAVIAIPLPMTAHTGWRATVQLTDAAPDPNRMVNATIRLDPPDIANDAEWFDVTAWQGGNGTYQSSVEGLVLDDLRQVAPGVYRTDKPFPVYGTWKALLRLHTGNSLQVVPIYLPEDEAIPAKEVPATAQFTRPFSADKKVLQREATGGSVNLQRAAYAVLGLLALLWIASLAWGLRRLDRAAQHPDAEVFPDADATRATTAQPQSPVA